MHIKDHHSSSGGYHTMNCKWRWSNIDRREMATLVFELQWKIKHLDSSQNKDRRDGKTNKEKGNTNKDKLLWSGISGDATVATSSEWDKERGR